MRMARAIDDRRPDLPRESFVPEPPQPSDPAPSHAPILHRHRARTVLSLRDHRAAALRPDGASPESARWVDLVVTIGIACAAAWAWIFGSERRVLAFSPADVTFLFPGPVTRRGLVSYKLLRAQLVVLFNTLLWTLLLTREQFGASPSLRALSLWVLLTTLSMHRIGASFVRSSVIEHGTTGFRFRVVSLIPAITGITILVWTLWRAVPDLLAALRAGGPDNLFAALSAVTQQPPLAWIWCPSSWSCVR